MAIFLFCKGEKLPLLGLFTLGQFSKLVCGFFLCALLVGCGGSSPKKSLRGGSNVYINDRTLCAYGDESFDKMIRLCNHKDELGLRVMESNGQISILEKNVKAVVVEVKFGKCLIRLFNGDEVWVASEFVDPVR